MKYLKNVIPLLLIVACGAPQVASATGIDVARPYNYSYMKINDPRKNGKAVKIPVSSCCVKAAIVSAANLLSPSANANTNLVQGNYQFGQFESSFNPAFSDAWSFTLAGTSQVKLSLFNEDLGVNSNLLNIANLKLELFDNNNNSLGSIANNQSLNVLLASSGQYSFLVSGSAQGKLGGLYSGKLEVAAVPIGDSLPFFTAALLMLGLQIRSRSLGSLRM